MYHLSLISEGGEHFERGGSITLIRSKSRYVFSHFQRGGDICPYSRVHFYCKKASPKYFLPFMRTFSRAQYRVESNLNNYNYSIKGFTYLVEKEDIELFPETFFPSLFQEYIEKKYELRVFYLNGKCYSMAIFSQNDKTTQVDFRNYNTTKPNRYVPFHLPEKVSMQIHQLMVFIGLNCGSIDILVDSQQVYYFLEVNPVGQFGMVSYPCNYFLEKEIASHLISNPL